MMRTTTAVFLALFALAGCSSGDGSNPFSRDDTDTPVDDDPNNTNDIPEDLAKNVQVATYNPSAGGGQGTLTVTLTGLDGDFVNVPYTRTAALDVGSYRAFTRQQDALDRHFTALMKQSADGSVRAGAIADGGQFNRFYGGGYYERTGAFDRPTTTGGLVSYAGDYAGVTNLDGSDGVLLPPAPGTDPSLLPAQSQRTQGNVFVNVDFNDNQINGIINNRTLLTRGDALPNVVLVDGVIDPATGTFTGSAEYPGSFSSIGSFGGIFGGDDSASIGGIVSLSQFDDGVLDVDGEVEYGVFVLTRCGTAGASPLCANSN